MARRPTIPPASGSPVTAEEIEIALDRVAEIMVARGRAGAILLPFYERLERELELARSVEAKMAEIRERVKRLRQRRGEGAGRKPKPAPDQK